MRFLETITCMGNEVLIPIDRIKYITIKVNDKGSLVILIKGDDEFDWEEYFGEDRIKAFARYNQIKEIVGAK